MNSDEDIRPFWPEDGSDRVQPLLNGRYKIDRKLGGGSIGEVWLARDEVLTGRPVVVKILRKDTARDEYLLRKFRQESEALARITDCPGIVGVLDAGEMASGLPFFVMQYINARTLRDAICERPAGMELERVAAIVRQLGQALTVAHEHGIVHRDLKPENIMLRRDQGEPYEQVCIIDFGIALIRGSQFSRSAVPSQLLGSFPYMAPERLLHEPCAASDIYALSLE